MISNSLPSATSLFVEPWGGEYPVATGCALDVVIRAPTSPVLELDIRVEGYVLIVHGPSGVTVAVYSGGIAMEAE